MVKEYRPVFNRTYLKILPWVVAIAIVLLTAKGVKDTFPSPEPFQETSLYTFVHKEQEADLLRLVLVYPEPALEKSKAQHRAYQKALLVSAGKEPSITATWFKDRLQLDVLASHLKQNSLKDILEKLHHNALTVQPGFDTEAAAEIYLQSQSSEELALTNLKLLILSDNRYTQPTTLVGRIRTALLLSREEQAELATSLAKQLPESITPKLNKPQPRAHTVKLTSRGSDHLLLTGTVIESREQAQYRLLLPLLNELLKQFKAQALFEYRLLLKPAFAALMISKDTPFSRQPTQNLSASFNDRLSEEDLHAIRKELIKQHQQRLESLPSKTQYFTDQLYYQRPVESVEAFSDTLNAISLKHLKQSLNALLDSDQTIHIMITPHE